MAPVGQSLFRPEALAHHEGSGDELGDVIRFEPKWSRIAASVLGFAVLGFFLFIALVGVDDYASGPVVIRVEGRRLVTSATMTSVESVNVQPGAWVEANQALVRMKDDEEKSELARSEKDFDNQMLRILRDPNDQAAKEALATLRAKRDQAKNGAEAGVIRAPVGGHLSDTG